MRKSDGNCVLDFVNVVELNLERTNLEAPTRLAAKYAVGSTKTATMIGPGHRNANWSERTVKAIEELYSSIEQDIAVDLFEGQSTVPSTESGEPDPSDGVPGL